LIGTLGALLGILISLRTLGWYPFASSPGRPASAGSAARHSRTADREPSRSDGDKAAPVAPSAGAPTTVTPPASPSEKSPAASSEKSPAAPSEKSAQAKAPQAKAPQAKAPQKNAASEKAAQEKAAQGKATRAEIKLSRATAARGASVTISGSGFQPGESVELRIHQEPIGTAKADAEGKFSQAVTIPPSAPPPGFPTSISATGRSSSKSGTAPFSTARGENQS
jgi:hypothetical protein